MTLIILYCFLCAFFFSNNVIKYDEITSSTVVTAIYRKEPCVRRYLLVDFHDAAHGEIASLQK